MVINMVSALEHELSPRLQKVLQAVDHHNERTKAAATTKDVARLCELSARRTRELLVELEKLFYVKRFSARKGWWALSPHEERVLKVASNVHRRTRKPVKTIAVAAHTGGYAERTVRYWLTNLERKGLLLRLRSRTKNRSVRSKVGWFPISVG